MLSTVQAKSFWPALYLYTNKRIKLQNFLMLINFEMWNVMFTADQSVKESD